MANLYAVTDLVAKESLRVAHEQLAFIGTVDRQYDETFQYQANRGKSGQTLRVKLPNQYTRRQGSRVMDVQEQNESAQTITVATQDGVDMRFNSQELIQSVSNEAAFDDLSKNYIVPAMSVLVSGIEADFLAMATKATYNVAGTAGSPINSLTAIGAARAKLNQGLAPKIMGERSVQMDSVTMASLVGGTASYFAPVADVGERFREGFVKRTGMADFYENERVWTMTNGSDVTGTTDAAALVTDGGNTVDMHTTIAVSAVNVGQVFTIAGVYACHPETKASHGTLQQFTITAIGSSTVTVSPSIYLTGPRKNVVNSTGGTLATTDFNSQTLTFVGNASTSYVQSLMYHKEAFQFVTGDLPILDDAQKCVIKKKDGLSVRVWMASDIRNDELLMRLDILYGMAALRPAWACRMIGS